jgi:hypothetical protein
MASLASMAAAGADNAATAAVRNVAASNGVMVLRMATSLGKTFE